MSRDSSFPLGVSNHDVLWPSSSLWTLPTIPELQVLEVAWMITFCNVSFVASKYWYRNSDEVDDGSNDGDDDDDWE